MSKAGNSGKPDAGSGPDIPEFTIRAAFFGIVIGVLFGAANAYIGLKVGLTVSASIPAAVMSVSIFRVLRRSGFSRPATILENNMVQTIGSAGESLAAGVIFTVPALILLGISPGVLQIFVLGSIGGILGIMFMIPLRRYLIVREHGRLVYPEGTACASVLVAGQEGGAGGGTIFAGLGLGALFEYLVSGAGLWKPTAAWQSSRLPGAEFSADSSTALLGVGFVIGPRIAAIMFGGGALAWLVFIPAIKLFAGGNPAPIYPATVPVASLDPHGIWNFYMRYIGAGAVVFGGMVTLIRSLPVVITSGWAVLKNFRPRAGQNGTDGDRTDRDLPGLVLAIGVVGCFLAMVFLPRDMAPGEFLSALLAVVFAFFFVAVSSRIVGLIGSSSNPVSGMTIAALLGTTLVFKMMGWTGDAGKAMALAVGAIVCISAAIAGDTSQDLKTGWLVKATPWRQQTGEIVGVLTSAAVIGMVVLRLNKAYGIGSETLPAPQATLMSMVVQGVLSGDLPYTLVFIGMAAAAVVEILGIPSLPFAVGLYLPLSLTTPILLGGLVRWLAERPGKKPAGAAAAEPSEKDPGGIECAGGEDEMLCRRGVLFASGLIAGAAFVGLLLGLLRSFGEGSAFAGCLSGGGFLGCVLNNPGHAAAAAVESIRIGPGWAGSWQDLLSGLMLAVSAVVLYFIAAKKSGRDAERGGR